MSESTPNMQNVMMLAQMFGFGNNSGSGAATLSKPTRDPAPVVVQPAPAHGGDVLPHQIVEAPTRMSQAYDELTNAISAITNVSLGSLTRRAKQTGLTDAAHGGWIEDLLGLAGIGDGEIVAQLGGATQQALSKLARLVENHRLSLEELAKRSNVAAQRNEIQTGQINRIYEHLEEIHMRWNERYGEEGVMSRTAMAVAQSLPGLRAQAILSAPAYQQQLKTMAEVGVKVNDLDEYTPLTAPVWSAVDGSVAQDVEDGFSEVQAQMALLINKVNAENEALREAIEAFGVKEQRDAVTTLQAQTAPDILQTLTRLLPSQIVDRTQAGYEAIAKVVLGQPSGAGGLLSGFGITL